MLLEIRCKECEKVIGSYTGLPFYVCWDEEKQNYSLMEPVLRILCLDCWQKRGDRNHETEFQAIRPQILKRDGYRCRNCGEPSDIVHHIDGDRSNNKPQNLITLCAKHHHSMPKYPYRTVRSLRTVNKTTTPLGYREYMKSYMRDYRARAEMRKLLNIR